MGYQCLGWVIFGFAMFALDIEPVTFSVRLASTLRAVSFADYECGTCACRPRRRPRVYEELGEVLRHNASLF